MEKQVRNRIIKWSLITLLSGLLLFIALVFIILRFYEDDLAKYAFQQAESRFKTTVKIGDIDLAFWQTFPHASLELQDVYVESAIQPGDTLLSAQHIFLEFGLFDLFGDSLRLHTLNVDQGVAKLQINKQGLQSWDVMKETDRGEDAVILQLDEIDIEEMDGRYQDFRTQRNVHAWVESCKLDGEFDRANYQGGVDFDGELIELQFGDYSFANTYEVSVKAQVDVNASQKNYAWSSAEITIADLALVTNGAMRWADDELLYKIDFNAEEAALDEFTSLAPKTWKDVAEQYGAYGDVKLSGFMQYERKNDPLKWEIQLTCQEGRLKHLSSGVNLEELALDAKLEGSGDQVVMHLQDFKGNIDEGRVAANGLIRWGQQQDMNLMLEVNSNLTQLIDFIAIDSLEATAGSVELKLHLVGPWPNDGANHQVKDLVAEGYVRLKDASLSMVGSSHAVNRLQLDASFSRNELLLNAMTGEYGGVPFQLSGALTNFTHFVVGADQRLKAHALLKVQELVLDPWLTDDSSSPRNGKFGFPPNVDFTIEADVRKLAYRGFIAEQVQGICSVTDRKILISPLDFKSLQGAVFSEVQLTPQAEGYLFDCKAQLSSISLPLAFRAFENFHQTFIQEENVKGDATAQIQFTASLNADWKLRDETISSVVSIQVKNGELIELPAMTDVANAIRANRWFSPFVNEDEFERKTKHIQFAELENIIEIKNRTVYIPAMDIKSNAMNISVVGTHSFDGAIDYSIGFALRDLFRPKNAEQDKPGMQLFILMTGTTDQPQFSFDRDAMKQNRREKIQEEKRQIMDRILNGGKISEPNDDSNGGLGVEDVPTQQDSIIEAKRIERRKKWKEILIDE
ncbi:MAG: AsmA-like C-terminal region-containing protein [Flavobacteriales bacterium]